MSIRAAALLLAVACVATPLAAQQPQATAPAGATQMREASTPRTTVQSGPRMQPDYQRYEARLANDSTTATTAAAADRTTITISTLALIVIVVLVILLIAD